MDIFDRTTLSATSLLLSNNKKTNKQQPQEETTTMAETFYPHQCSFCMETFRDPRFLKGCSHSICLSCAEFQFSSQLSSLFASSTSSSNTGYPLKKEKDGKSMNSSQGKAEVISQGIPITCCKCNKKTFIPLESSPEKELPKNHDLNELLLPTKDECSGKNCSQEATHGCIECKKMFCQKHRESHDDLALDGHDCLSVKEYKEKISKGSGRVKCKDHEIPCHYFCKDCNTMVCNVCKEGKAHKNHDTKLWEEEKDELKAKSNQKMKDLKKRRDVMDEIKEETKTKQVEVKKKHETTMKEIDNFEKQVISFIQNKCNQMRQKYDEDYNHQLKSLQIQQQNMEKIIKEIDKLLKLNMNDFDTPNSIIQQFKKLSLYSHQIQSIPSSIHFDCIDIQMNHHQKQVESSLLEWFDKQFKITQNSYTITSSKIKLKGESSEKYIEDSTHPKSSQGNIRSKSKLSSRKRKDIQLKGKLMKIAGKDNSGFDNSSMQDAMFYYPWFLKYNQSSNKLYISDSYNHIIRSIKNISTNNKNEWDGELKIEVGRPKQQGYSNGDRNTCKLKYPRGFDWDKNDNMYICNNTCICKVERKSNQVSLVAGHANDEGYKDGNNHEARFDYLTGILCYQQNHQYPLTLHVCDQYNHCIRMVDVTNGKTTTLAGKGNEEGDVDATLQSARFYAPWDIVKDDKNVHILYVSDSWNHKIKMIDMKKGMVSTLVGDKKDTSILNRPQKMQIIDSFIYVACYRFKDCIVKIDKHSKQVTKIKFNDGKQVSGDMYGITYHELDQCFYISDYYNIYKFE